MSELQNLLIYASEIKDQHLIKKLAFMILKYSNKDSDLTQAQNVLSESVDIDLWALEAMVRPEKFDFPEPDIGKIDVEVNN